MESHGSSAPKRIQRQDAKAQRRQGERGSASNGELGEQDAFLPPSPFAPLRLGDFAFHPSSAHRSPDASLIRSVASMSSGHDRQDTHCTECESRSDIAYEGADQ